MKLKSDFVTNSSSTIYMIVFPSKKPVITTTDVAKAVYENIPFEERNNKSLAEFINLNKCVIEDAIEKMFVHYETMHQDDIEEMAQEKYKEKITKLEKTFDCWFFHTLIEVLYSKNCVVDAQSVNGEGSTMIIVLDRERVLEILKNEIQT